MLLRIWKIIKFFPKQNGIAKYCTISLDSTIESASFSFEEPKVALQLHFQEEVAEEEESPIGLKMILRCLKRLSAWQF